MLERKEASDSQKGSISPRFSWRKASCTHDMANRSKDNYKEENAQLKKRIRDLETALEFSKMETCARDMMIDKAEEYYPL